MIRRFAVHVAAATLWASAVWAPAQPYGMTSRPDVGPFLNDALPETAPVFTANWTVVPAFPHLLFTNAVGLTFIPGTDLLCVWEREGRVWSFVNHSNTTEMTLVLDISDQCQGWDDSGLLGVAFHPGFQTNGHMFVYYTWVTPGTVVGDPTTRPPHTVAGKYHDRLSRFTLDLSGVAIPGSETVLVDQTGDDAWHNGGGLFFHPENGFLYWTDGDDANSGNSQSITNKLLSGVFRIDVDMRGGEVSHPPPRQPNLGFTANYYIPNDNPFVGQPNVLEEFFCLGLRNPHRMTIDPPTGRIYIGDVGEGSREEIDIIEPGESGLNFQWSRIEGLNGDLTPPYIGIDKRPVLDYPRADGRAVIGGYVYRGNEFAAELGGRYIFGDNVSRTIWVMDEFTTPATKLAIATLPRGDGPNSGSDYTGLSSFGIDADNELYLCQMSSIGGRIYKLARAGEPPGRPLPERLSETGVFSDLATLTPAPGLIPYAVNAPLWSDGALKTRWIAVPTNTFVTFSPTGSWAFPDGTVFVKHFDLPANDTNASVLRRLETRILVRDIDGFVYGATYRWRPDYSDADLVNTMTNEAFLIPTATGVRTQMWSYPGRQDCLTCHTAPSGGVLGVNTRQLNGDWHYAATGVTDNQLRAWNHAGLFSSPLNEGAIPDYRRLVDVSDTNAPLELRARSYLDANCSQCHRPNGGVTALFDARFDTPLENQGIVNGAVLNTLGNPAAKVVHGGSLTNSILYRRVNTLSPIKMPPLARNVIDSNAVALLEQWIGTLPPPTNSLPPPWEHGDIGFVGIPGDAAHAGGQFTVSGSGADIWDNADGFHFVYMPFTGDGQIVARVASMQNPDAWAKAGVMFRETLSAESKHAYALISAANGAAFQRRPTTAGPSEHTPGPAVSAPYWVRLTRVGDTFTTEVSPDGDAWTLIGSVAITMSNQVFVGLAVTAHNNGALNTSVFDNVTVASGTPTLPSVTLLSPADGASYPFGADIPLVAEASSENGGITNVIFLREMTLLGSDGSDPHEFLWIGPPAGTFDLRAVAFNSFGTSATSAPVKVNIYTALGTNGFSARVNFQTDSSELFAGYLPDQGAVYDDRGNGYAYGWDIDNTAHSRQRDASHSYDARYDTFNHMQKPGGGTQWEIAVPNGLYQIRIVSGDADFFDGDFRIDVEGTLLLAGTPSNGNRWFEAIGVRSVSDGRLTISNGAGAVNNKICFVEVTALPASGGPTRIAASGMTSAGFGLLLEGADGVDYVIEATTNFSIWTPIFTNTPFGNRIEFIDPEATNHPLRFYRGRER
ncbi:MAG TPA: hypothetical protein GYA07_04425 [Verrucomicrobia bacterium]|nr:hypothetical protein [Verrucomicrobiota bacterium]